MTSKHEACNHANHSFAPTVPNLFAYGFASEGVALATAMEAPGQPGSFSHQMHYLLSYSMLS